jgi:hypothetical protein
MDINTPIVFNDGTDVFKKLKKEYITHKKGRFILAASGTGKSYYVNNQKDRHWIDGDYFWEITNADLTPEEWVHDMEIVMEVNNRSDIMTQQAIKQGLWIVGSSNNWLKPDAIVILDEKTHRLYINKRENSDYDGGAKDEDFESVKRHNEVIKRWAGKGVPMFDSIDAATKHFIDLDSKM